MEEKIEKKLSIYTLISGIIMLVHILPIYITLTNSFKRKVDLTSSWLFPNYVYLNNFKEAFSRNGVTTAIWNTIFITLVSLFFIVIIGAMAAYPLSRVRSKLMFRMEMFIIGLMMIPALTTLVPMYTMFVKIGGVNTYWGVMLIHITNHLPMAIFLYANFMRSIPTTYDEAALVDGCSRFKIFYLVILPQLKGVTASVMILTGVKIWNDYPVSLYFLQSPRLQTVTLAISNSFQTNSSNLNVAAATALICVTPILVMYLTLQRYFVSGESDGGVKG